MPILTLEELKKKHGNAKAKPIFTLEQAQREAGVKKQITGNQFDQEDELGGFRNTRQKNTAKVATAIFGGGELAEGLGKAIAAPKIQKDLEETESMMSDTALLLVKQINKAKKEGRDSSRLEKALADLQGEQRVTRDVQEDFTASLPTNKQVIGSAFRLVTNAVMPTVGGAVAKRLAISKAISGASGAVRGGATGAVVGALEGGTQGFGAGLEQDQDVSTALLGGAVGAGTGFALGGAIGGTLGAIKGVLARKQDPNTILEYVTPKANELTPTQYNKAVVRGQVTPKTAFSEAKYTMPDAEREIAFKYSDLVDKDPVRTAINITDQIADLDDEVSRFLDGADDVMPLVDKESLVNRLTTALDDVTDITVDDVRLNATKQKLISNFVSSLDDDEYKTLWRARKDFDQRIGNAFKGSPTLQKEIKTTFRNTIQEFIAENTPDNTYKELMEDMTRLYRLRDNNVLIKAPKERAMSELTKWIKDNPKKVRVAEGAGLIIAGKYFLPDFLGFGNGGGSSGG